MEYCECCGVGKRNGCEMNPSDESIFDGMCDECREEEEQDDCSNCGGAEGTELIEPTGEYWCKTCVIQYKEK
jgi:hypothetical protein